MKFFGDEGRRLVDDGSGCITYRPHFLDETEAQRAFQALRSSVVWHRERRLMYDREVEVPRLTAHYRLGALMPGPLPELFVRVREAASAPFNSVGLNLYRDERDSVAPHNDHLSEIAPRYPIALVSLGETRLMTIRSKERPRRAFDIDLEPGSLLTMSYETQRAYDHGIPKQRRRMGSRMSVVFRVRPED
ncbi:MAG: alpha-ketoglutarate-dependent dioxygenase AlkB [Candidatus Tyrphobacter sp.]